MDFTHLSTQLSSSPLTALPILFIAGVLTSLAPCIYPMIPITAAIVGGTAVGEAPRARAQTVLLTFAYVLGLSLAYASVGLFAGLTGTLFGLFHVDLWRLLPTGLLGVALEDLGRAEDALSAYERAAELDPANADAHFNAASVCEHLGQVAAALRHLKAYRKLLRGSSS